MGWLDYYKLLEKYNGNLAFATKQELRFARNANPNTPSEALAFASVKYRQHQHKKIMQETENRKLALKK